MSGYIDLNTKRLNSYDLPQGSLEQVAEWYELPYESDPRSYLYDWVQPDADTTGVEVMLRAMEIGDEAELKLFMTNGLHNVKDDAGKPVPPYARLEQLKVVISEVTSPPVASESYARLSASLIHSDTYEQWLGLLALPEADTTALLDFDQARARRLRMAYLAPRDEQDTAKALYRLISIGVIDDYTIDYQNSLYELRFTKKEDNEYFRLLGSFLARYSSQRRSEVAIAELKAGKAAAIAAGEATVIGVCLEFLTDYIYDNIRLKRQRAIRDMVQLCRQAVQVHDRFEHNQLIRDEIFFYFNAKYSRPGYVEQIGEREVSASLIDAHTDDRPAGDIIYDFLALVEASETGEFINNVKHLRGSTMRLLRSYPNEPHFLILKGFALFCLGTTLQDLRSEAVRECVEGLLYWKQLDASFDMHRFIRNFELRLSRHISEYNIAPYLGAILQKSELRFYSEFLRQLNDRLLPQPSV